MKVGDIVRIIASLYPDEVGLVGEIVARSRVKADSWSVYFPDAHPPRISVEEIDLMIVGVKS